VDIPERDIQLILPTGDRTFFKEDIQLKYDETGNIIVQNEAGDMLDELESNNTHIDLNKLVVPKGKRSSLLLADGSIIWINSGTTVEFPSTFRGMDKRKIKVDGEIYIEVEKDTLRPFLVETPRFDVSVLGTKFNVMAYSEDQVQHVTVAEGLVSVYAENENQKEFVGINQQLSMSKNETTLKEVDVYNYISWKDGVLRFESEPLRNILERLSRYYDIQLNYESDIETIRCSGKLYLFDEWQLVFDNITKVTPVKYSIKNNEVTFKYISNK
jgi:ferric-dicitrate binding protein FerR (iron transport regulator)